MSGQGRSTLSETESGHILDRLQGLEQIVSSDCVQEVLRQCNKVNGRSCPLTHEVMLWVVLAMGLFTNVPIREAFRRSRRRQRGDKTPARSSLCAGRQRLGVEPLQALHQRVVRPLATPQTPGAFYQGMRLMALDGTILDAPDREANQSLGRSSGGRGDAAFPQVRKVSLVEVGTHVEIALVHGGYHDSEQALVPALYDQIPSDALLLEDRGFFSYQSWKTLQNRCELLVRVKTQMVLPVHQRLSDGSYLSKVYSNSYDRDQDRNGVVVRVIEYTLNDPQRTGHGEVHCLITSLLDEKTYPAKELICLYHERWEIEMVFDEQKTHQDPLRAGKPTHLRSETPAGIAQELVAISIGHFVVRAMMLQAAEQADLDVDRLSFVGCFRILQTRLPECNATCAEGCWQWFEALKEEMLEEKIPPRSNRVNPRVIKRKMKKWKKKRPHHRGIEPLTKTFGQTIVMET